MAQQRKGWGLGLIRQALKAQGLFRLINHHNFGAAPPVARWVGGHRRPLGAGSEIDRPIPPRLIHQAQRHWNHKRLLVRLAWSRRRLLGDR